MPGMTDVQTPNPSPVYKTRTFQGQGGNISMSKPGDSASLAKRKAGGVAFQKARKQRK